MDWPKGIMGERAELLSSLWELMAGRELATKHIRQIIKAFYPNGPHYTAEMSREEIQKLYSFIIARAPQQIEEDLNITFEKVNPEDEAPTDFSNLANFNPKG